MSTGIKVKDAMVSRVVTGKPTETVVEASKIMKKEDVGTIVVCEGKKPVGIVTREDIVNKVASKDLQPSKVSLREIMTTKVVTAAPEEDLADAARTMTKHGFVRLPVVSLGKLVGIITDREIAKVAPAAIEILRERLLIEAPGFSEETNSGECQLCGNYSEELHNINDRWVCDSCKEEAAEI